MSPRVQTARSGALTLLLPPLLAGVARHVAVAVHGPSRCSVACVQPSCRRCAHRRSPNSLSCRTPSFPNKPLARCFTMGPVRVAGAHYAVHNTAVCSSAGHGRESNDASYSFQGLHCTGVAGGEKEVLSMARCNSIFSVLRSSIFLCFILERIKVQCGSLFAALVVRFTVYCWRKLGSTNRKKVQCTH